MAENNELVPAGLAGMITTERPEGKDAGSLGNEGMGRDDVAMPRLGLAQKMSKEVDPTNAARYIEGLQFQEMFNSLTKQRFGKGPLYFCILRRDAPRFIEFFPIADGGGIKDMNVPVGDPRTDFTTGEGGQRIKPVATKFYDYIVLLLNEQTLADPASNIIALSLKSSGLKVAKKINMFIQQRAAQGKTICKGVYKLTTGHDTDKTSGSTYAIFNVDNAGWLQAGSPIEELAVGMFESFKEREVKIDRDENPDDFNPAQYDQTATPAADM